MDSKLPAEVFPPGEFILDELEARGQSQEDLANLLGRRKSYINEIIKAKRKVNEDIALELEAALDIDAEFWLKTQNSYDLYCKRLSEKNINNIEQINRKRELSNRFAYTELIKRGWITGNKNFKILEAEILTFFDIANIDIMPNLACAARKSNYNNNFDIKQIAWVKRAEQIAFENYKRFPIFDMRNFENFINSQLPKLMHSPECLSELIQLYKQLGVVIIGLKTLPGMKMQACQFWVDKKTPVIVFSFSHDKFDRFWFNLLHETAHIIHQDAIDVPILDFDDNQDKPDFEIRADQFASNLIIPENDYKKLLEVIEGMNEYNIRKKAKSLAEFLNIDHSLVYGRLQNDKILPWKMRMKTSKALPYLKDIILCEGF